MKYDVKEEELTILDELPNEWISIKKTDKIPHVKYLKNRGFKWENVKLMDVMWDKRNYGEYVLFPVMENGFVVSYEKRCIISKKNWDIDINWVSIQNECIFAQFYRSCLYHGPGMREAVRAVSNKFDKEKINAKILINEDVFFPQRVFSFLQPVFADPDTKNFQGNIAVHRRAGPKGLKEWKDLTAGLNRKNWMTETSGHDTTWQGAFTLANDIHNYLAIGNFSAWLYWQISGETGGSNEQVYTLMLNGKPTKKYYTSKHFYRYIRPGAIRIKTESPSDSLSISSYKHPDTGILTLVMLNNSSNTLHISLETQLML